MLAEENKNSGRKLRSDTPDTHLQLAQTVGSTWIKTRSAEDVNLTKALGDVCSLKLLWIIFSAEERE